MHPAAERTREQVAAARAAKRAHAESLGIDEDFISRMVEHFYARVREDEMLGSIFAERIGDWEAHLARMKQFWRSILFGSGEFSGNPMRKHIAIAGLEEAHFAHWLRLFYATLHELGAKPEGVALVAGRARMIADSLLTGIAVQRDGWAAQGPGTSFPMRPDPSPAPVRRDLPEGLEKYAETPVFDADSVPARLTADHDLKPGVWGRLCVLSGALEYVLAQGNGAPQLVRAGQWAIIEPQQRHRVRLLDGASFKVEFYRAAQAAPQGGA